MKKKLINFAGILLGIFLYSGLKVSYEMLGLDEIPAILLSLITLILIVVLVVFAIRHFSSKEK